MNNKNNKTKTFEVDAKGFKVQMEEIGTGRLIAELISNSLDEESVGTIKVRITKHGELILSLTLSLIFYHPHDYFVSHTIL